MNEDYTIEELGQIAFEAYRISTEGLTYDKKPIPTWNELTDAVRKAWMAAGYAVKAAIMGEAGENQEV